MIPQPVRILTISLLLLAEPAMAASQGSNIVLKTAWAQKYRNRVSIEANVTILKVSGKEVDADIHGGSRENQIGLPMVAEILNGAEPSQQPARSGLAPGTNPQKNVYGAWRIWFEHPPSGGTQCQHFTGQAPDICLNQTLTGPDSNPKHSFEIHPIFEVDGVRVGRSSLVVGTNAQIKETDQAFRVYTGPNKKITIARTTSGITLNSLQIMDNYVRMRVRVRQTSTPTKRNDGSTDGGWIRADVLVSDPDLADRASNLRVFYFLDSMPGDRLKTAAVDDEFEIVAIPRLNLDAILSASQANQVVQIPLPFEFVAVGMVGQ